MGKKLYVGNLSYRVSSSDLEQIFSQYGSVESAEVISDRDTGRSKGFGFVEMSSEAEATGGDRCPSRSGARWTAPDSQRGPAARAPGSRRRWRRSRLGWWWRRRRRRWWPRRPNRRLRHTPVLNVDPRFGAAPVAPGSLDPTKNRRGRRRRSRGDCHFQRSRVVRNSPIGVPARCIPRIGVSSRSCSSRRPGAEGRRASY